ncbi:MAG: hypothetical protein WA979_03110 [Pacificimonas sp.]
MFRFPLACAAAIAALTPTAPAGAQFAFDGEELTAAAGTKLRRAPLSSVLRGNAAWRTLFDAAPLTIEEASCLPPTYRLCLLSLSTPGESGVSLLEVDVERGVPVEGGFVLGRGPNRVAWYDDERIMLAGNSGPGTVTAEGEARLLTLWQRGTSPTAAQTILAVSPGGRDLTPIFDVSTGGLFHAATLTDASGADQLYHFGWEQNFVESRLPARFTFQGFFQGRAVALLGATWNGIPAGSLAAYPMSALMSGARQTVPELAYQPPAGYGVERALGGRDRLFVLLRGAAGDRLMDLRVGEPQWRERRLDVPGDGRIELLAVSRLADSALVRRNGKLFAVGRGRTRGVSAP